MDQEKQRIAIAEVCGWTFDKRTPTEKVVTFLKRWLSPNKNDTNHHFCPNYPSDLNAIHEAEKIFQPYTKGNPQFYDGSRSHYLNALYRLTGPDEYPTATAAQRAEALLRTLNLWEEDD